MIKKLCQTKRKAVDAFRQDLPIQFESILPRWNDTPIAGAGFDAGNEIFVFRWRPNESKLPKALVTNEKRLSHLSVAEVIFFEALGLLDYFREMFYSQKGLFYEVM